MINKLEPTVVIIDDVKEEIQGIIDDLSEKGVGCKFFNPDYSEGDDMPTKTYSDVNILFLDLFYSGNFDAEQSCNWVRSIIPKNSFYIIVFWTKDISRASEVLILLKERDIPPFKYFVESKSEYIVGGAYNFKSLLKKINDACDNSPALEEIIIWKKALKLTANEVIGHLINNDEDAEIIKKIIISHGGNSTKAFSDIQKRIVLFDALDIVLTSNTRKNISGAISDINADTIYKLENIATLEPDKKLNSWFHFKLISSISNDLILSGLISDFKDKGLIDTYSILDDKHIKEYLSKQTDSRIKLKPCVMVLTRPCDIAQDKFGKNIKLLSGVRIVNPNRKNNVSKEFKGGSSKLDSIKIYDHLYFSKDETDCTLIFDYRYSFSLPKEQFISKFDNVKIFNKELLSEIQVEYSSYSSRLGITQII
ncbi:hypothetical protein SAMN05444405_104176 [Bacteroides luti]|uniref:Response receiver domain-containing protein n=1 Tax=Bacteroides luti TaxID=1297750 RepID=A0A1M4Y0F5_9BACE|nr:hypothetical protein [Bacteroides luti]SHE99076.1 hypothetical protein SAMN05444405_104176 [Bacteroides luti]